MRLVNVAVFSGIALACAAGQAFAQAAPQGPGRAHAEAQVSRRVSDIAARLELTRAQRELAEPIMRESFQRRAAMMLEAQRDGSISFFENLSLRSRSQSESQRMLAQLDDFLTPQQMNALREIEEERMRLGR